MFLLCLSQGFVRVAVPSSETHSKSSVLGGTVGSACPGACVFLCQLWSRMGSGAGEWHY